MNVAALQVVAAPQPLVDRLAADTSFDHLLADHIREIQTVDATVGDPGRLASPWALTSEVMEGLRGFMQRADAMTKSGWKTSGGHHRGPDALSVVAQASLQPVSFSSTDVGLVPQGKDDPLDHFDDIVRQALDDFSFYVQAEMLSHSASSLGHTANTLAKGQ
jgi:hypothetical protein